MDTHVSEIPRSDLALDTRSRPRVSLPGEADVLAPAATPAQSLAAEPPPPDQPPSAKPYARLGKASSAKTRRRRWMLGSVAILVLGGAGGGFLLSPYNANYSIDITRLRNERARLVVPAGQQEQALVAPAAKVAHAPPLEREPLHQGQSATAPRPDDPMRELLAFRQAPPDPVTPATAAAPPRNAIASAPAFAQSVSPEPPVSSVGATPSIVSPSATPAVQFGTLTTANIPPIQAVVTSVATTPPAPPPSATSEALVSTVVTRSIPPTPNVSAFVTVIPASSELSGGPARSLQSPPDATTEPRVLLLTPQVLETGVPPARRPVQAALAVASPPTPATKGFELAVPALTESAAPSPGEPASRATALREIIPHGSGDPADPVAAAAELRATPMTPAGQIEVLNLVTRLGIVLRDMRAENAALKARVESTADRFDTAVTDFDRRLALAEARGAMSAAMGAVAPAVAATSPGIVGADVQPVVAGGARTRPPAPPPGVQIASAPATGTPTQANSARYRVTAASPGLAMLSLLDRSGGEGSQLQVAIGDAVPGYGRVIAIQQRGSSWIVQTDKGPDKGVIQ